MLLIEAAMTNPAGEPNRVVPRLHVDRLIVQLRGPGAASDAGLPARRKRDDAPGLTTMLGEMLDGAHGPE
jgi:hypothetical protein